MKKQNKKKVEKPSVRKYLIYCEGCNSSSGHFMTLVEFYAKRIIQQWCRDCEKITKWKSAETRVSAETGEKRG